MTVAFMVASCQLATPARAEEKVAPPAPAATVAVDSGASDDVAAISDAAEDFEAGDPAAVADLADAATAADEVPLKKTNGGFRVADDDGAEIAVTKDGEVTLSAPGVPEIGISVAGDAEASKLVDGVLVQTEVAPSTDVVTRATDNGVQLIAVLADADAPNEIEFPLELPSDGRIVLNKDGSIDISATVSRTVLRSEGQKAGTPAGPESVTSIRRIASIEEPWAVDARGRSLDTHYVVDGLTIRQVVETDSSTDYPVTMDPTTTVWFDGVITYFSKSEVKRVAGKASYLGIGAAACGIIPNALVAAGCGLYAGWILTDIGEKMKAAAKEKQCAKVVFNWYFSAIGVSPVYAGTKKYSC